jgi:MFS family permease
MRGSFSFPRRLPATVIVLGLASLFTDLSSEMIYPLLPIFLTAVLGAGAAQLGLIEGVAESTASILKVVSGWWTDRVHRRKPFIVSGYGLSGVVRPLIGLATIWPAVLLLRFLDRVGKGVRTSPRDALIADVTPNDQRGAAYGFHRAMDHAGAVLGPLAAAALLHWMHFSIRSVFLWAALPGFIVLLLLLLGLHDSPAAPDLSHSPSSKIRSWREFNPAFRFYLWTLFVFTLGNSSDAFLLIWLARAGLTPASIAVLWSFHNAVRMVSNYYLGGLADRWPARTLIRTGWVIYAGVYLGFARCTTLAPLVTLFLIYGLFYGFSEPAERALVSRLTAPPYRGTAFGYFHGLQGLAALPASLLFGLIWKWAGAPAAFLTGASLAAAAAVLLSGGRASEN